MKKYLLPLFALFLGNLMAQTSAPILPASKMNVTSAVGADPATLNCIIQDDFARFAAADFAVGDSVYLIDGSDLLVYRVTVINSAAGNVLNITVDDVNNTGIAAPTGQGAIMRPTANKNYPIYISGLRDDLRAMIMNRQIQLIDRDIEAAKEITFYVGGTGVAPGFAPGVDDPILARNGVGEMYRYDGTAWQPLSPSASVVTTTTAGLFPAYNSLETVTASTSQQAKLTATTGAGLPFIWVDAAGTKHLEIK